MKNKYWLTLILLIGAMRVFGQDIRVNGSSVDNKLATKVANLKFVPLASKQEEDIHDIRVNNSFIILINNKLATSVASLKFVLTDTTGKENIINGGYYPGVLYVNGVGAKNILHTDTTKRLTLKFDYYDYRGKKQFISNYNINISQHWFKESLIILKIYNVNKNRGTYEYTFEVPGIYFPVKRIKGN